MRTPGVIFAAVFLVLQTATTVLSLREQYGVIYCDIDDGTNTMKVNMFVLKNGTDITNAHFIEIDDLIVDRKDEADCQWIGDGSFDDPFRYIATVNFDTDTVSPANCGMQVTTANTKYTWYVLANKLNPFLQEEDEIYEFSCDINDRLPTELTIEGTVLEYDLLKDLNPTAGLLSLVVIDNKVDRNPLNKANVGDQLAVQLSYQPGANPDQPNADSSLYPWGAYCEEFYAMSGDLSRKVSLLDVNTCPRTDFPFLRPEDGFIGTLPDNLEKFRAYLEGIEAAKFDKPASDQVTFVCYAKLCRIRGDQKCIDSCATLSAAAGLGRRKKRSSELSYRLSATVQITDGDTQEEPKQQISPENEIAWYVWVIISFVAFLILILGITACVVSRMRPKDYKSQHDSYASTNSMYSQRY